MQSAVEVRLVVVLQFAVAAVVVAVLTEVSVQLVEVAAAWFDMADQLTAVAAGLVLGTAAVAEHFAAAAVLVEFQVVAAPAAVEAVAANRFAAEAAVALGQMAVHRV